MMEFLTYLLKSSGLIVLFLCCYQFLLCKETFFTANRFFLLLGLPVSLLVPLLTITQTIEVAPLPFSIDSSPLATASLLEPRSSLPWQGIALMAYLCGCTFLTIRFIAQLLSIRKIILSGKRKKRGAFIFIETTQSTTPFSFFNYIVYPPDSFSERELQDVLAHEKIHVIGKHSVDRILVQLMAIFQWCNPFIWLYSKSVAQNLEFLADGHSFKTDKIKYQYLILRTSMGKNSFSLGNPFFNSFIKKRIIMLNKSRSNPLNVWKYATVFPLLTLFILLFNTQVVAQSMGPSTTNDTELQLQIGADATDAELQEQVSLFKARGIEVVFKKIKRNRQGKITGIFSSFKDNNGHKGNYSVSGDGPITSFVLNITYEDGEIDQIGYHTQSDKSTAGATTIMGKEDQGESSSVKVTTKTVQGDSSPTITTNEKTSTVISVHANDSITSSSGYTFVGPDQDPPLYIIDGETATTTEIQNLPPDQIGSINVHKGKSARDQYGEAGKNGVIIISTKKDGTATSQTVTSSSQHTISLTTDGESPLILLDGKEVDKKQMDQLDPKTIESLVVLKDASAIAEYGEKGKNGVLIIRTKKED